MSATPSTPFPAVSERIAEVIFVLCQTVSMRLRVGTVSQAQVTYIVGRLLGIRRRFQRLVARLRAGQTPRERAPKQPVAPAPAAEFRPEFPLGFRPPPPGWRRWAVHADKPVPLWRSLRQGFAWLIPVAPNVPDFRDSAAGHRAWLLAVLAEPETRALLLASRRVGDSLRPLCWMLGIESSVLYPARPADLTPDPVVPAPESAAAMSAPTADNRVPDPAPAVATLGPIMAAGTESTPPRPRAREGVDFFATD